MLRPSKAIKSFVGWTLIWNSLLLYKMEMAFCQTTMALGSHGVYYALNNKDVDFAVADVTGDPLIPSSSTILTNLRDLAQIGDLSNGALVDWRPCVRPFGSR